MTRKVVKEMENTIQDQFNFFMPFDIVKSKNPETEESEWRIAGYASTSKPDRENDIVLQKGLDISDFLNYGFLNYDHQSDKIVGYPDKQKTKLTNAGFWVEGVLLKTPLAKSIWETAVALKKSRADRKLGFSVEGKTLARDALGRITKAKVYHVAVTGSPVNTSCTFDALCKSFSTELLDKSMEAGYSSIVGEPNNGSCLKTEDLESAFRVLAKALGGNEDASLALGRVREFLNKSMNSEELALYFQLSKGLSREQSMNLVQKLQNQ